MWQWVLDKIFPDLEGLYLLLESEKAQVKIDKHAALRRKEFGGMKFCAAKQLRFKINAKNYLRCRFIETGKDR